jgi:hypothetical protein
MSVNNTDIRACPVEQSVRCAIGERPLASALNSLNSQLSTLNLVPLFVYDLDLLIDHLPGKPVDRHVYPVMLLAFDAPCTASLSRYVFS